jgi:hypothetical protein
MIDIDPTQLTLHELRALRAELHAFDDVVSYVRRVAQARLDLVDGEIQRRRVGTVSAPALELPELSNLLGRRLAGGPARPPRPANDASEHPMALEFEELCARYGIDSTDVLEESELHELRERIDAFERARSLERHELFTRIDALSAELVRRYRDGEADVDGLFVDS